MRIPILLILVLCTLNCGSQNLVPNPGFEEHIGCPMGYPDLEGVCQGWHSYRGTPDYLNNCSPVCGYYNQYGYQTPHAGEAYTGILTYHQNIPNGREHLGIELLQPLSIGTRYFVSFYVCAAWNGLLTNISSNKLGVQLTTYNYDDPDGNLPLPNMAAVIEETILTDTIQWHRIFGSFVADSAYEHLVIGNFFDDALIDTTLLPFEVVPQVAYYFLDDICLSHDSLYATFWTTIDEIKEESKAVVYPNPTSGNFWIKNCEEYQTIWVYDALGMLVHSELIQDCTAFQVDCQHLTSGLYFAVLQGQIRSHRIPLLIQ